MTGARSDDRAGHCSTDSPFPGQYAVWTDPFRPIPCRHARWQSHATRKRRTESESGKHPRAAGPVFRAAACWSPARPACSMTSQPSGFSVKRRTARCANGADGGFCRMWHIDTANAREPGAKHQWGSRPAARDLSRRSFPQPAPARLGPPMPSSLPCSGSGCGHRASVQPLPDAPPCKDDIE